MPFSKKKFESMPPLRRLRQLLKLLAADFPRERPEEWTRLVAWSEIPGDRELFFTPPNNKDYAFWKASMRARLESTPGMEPLATASEEVSSTRDRAAPLATRLEYGLLLHHLRSGHNTGSLLRSAEYFGLGQVFLSGYTPGVSHSSVRKSGMGAQDWLPVYRVGHYRELPRLVSLPWIGLEPDPAAESISDFEWPPAGLLVFGNEELGIEPGLRSRLDHLIRVPAYGRKYSLNVAVSAGIVFWELRRKLSLAGEKNIL